VFDTDKEGKAMIGAAAAAARESLDRSLLEIVKRKPLGEPAPVDAAMVFDYVTALVSKWEVESMDLLRDHFGGK
jgi:hypothetical protein